MRLAVMGFLSPAKCVRPSGTGGRDHRTGAGAAGKETARNTVSMGLCGEGVKSPGSVSGGRTQMQRPSSVWGLNVLRCARNLAELGVTSGRFMH